jgi:hypothetical protein
MNLGAYVLRRTVVALVVLMLVIAVVQFAVNLAMTRATRGDVDFFALFQRNRETWLAFPRVAVIALAALSVLVLGGRLTGTLLERARRADEVS